MKNIGEFYRPARAAGSQCVATENRKGPAANSWAFEFYGAQSRNRTKDTGIFSPLLYRLS